MGTALAMFLILGTMIPQPAWSIPAFARKEGVTCSMCHTTVPHLNEYGFRYRKAGFRDPGDIGKELDSFNYADVFSARVQARFDVKHRDMGNNMTTTSNQLNLHEVTLYPLSGSFGKHFGSLMELSAANEDFLEIENAYFRYTAGNEDAWYTIRFGLFHPFEGYGASDRPYALSRPFIQGSTANNGAGNATYFKLWGFDQAGMELAYVKNHTTASVTLFNGTFVTNDEGKYKAFPAAGGHLTKTAGFKNSDSKDVQVFLNQAIDENGSGLSAYYYYGQSDLPIPGVAPSNFMPSTSFENDFHRVAGYGSYVLSPQFEVMAGASWGRDNSADTLGTISTFNSQGFFGEADFHPSDITTVGGRFDYFDPSTDIDNNQKWGATAFANVPLNDGLQFIAQFQHVQQKRGTMADLKDDNFQLRMIWIQ